MKPKSFIFLGDILKIQDTAKTFNLFEDYELKKADTDQIRHIKKFLNNYSKLSLIQTIKFESKPVKQKNGGYIHEYLDRSEWKYWVIEYKRTQCDKLLPLTLALSSLNLTIFFEAIYSNILTDNGKEVPGFIHRQLSVINFLLDSGIEIIEKKVTLKEIDELKHIHSLLTTFKSIKKDFDFVDKALEDFLKLKDISRASPFKVLNYFSILELLLTTYLPKTFDASISYQLKKKINLINNISDNKINIQDYFKGPNTLTLEIIVEKLYKYRNNIAHGNKSDFENELQILKKQKNNIVDFLHILLRTIIIESIKNPSLIKDLKEC